MVNISTCKKTVASWHRSTLVPPTDSENHIIQTNGGNSPPTIVFNHTLLISAPPAASANVRINKEVVRVKINQLISGCSVSAIGICPDQGRSGIRALTREGDRSCWKTLSPLLSTVSGTASLGASSSDMCISIKADIYSTVTERSICCPRTLPCTVFPQANPIVK